MTPDESRFETDPEELVAEPGGLPEGWRVDSPDGDDPADVDRLVGLLRAHEEHGRGWSGAGVEEVLVEIAGAGARTRENVVVRDPGGRIRAWGSVHDRSVGRMLLVHVVERDLPAALATACSDVLVEWAVGQAGAVGAARGLTTQQIDTGAFAGDGRHQALLVRGGFARARTWWQMSRPVTPEEGGLVPDPERWEARGVTFRLVSRDGGGAPADLPDHGDLRVVHDVLEESFRDHFNSTAETFDEWLFRQRETPGHSWDQWWLAELAEPGGDPVPAGALIGTVSRGGSGPDGSYVSYVGVVGAARGRGVAKGLLHTIIADAARAGRDRVGLEVDADSSTGAEQIYLSMGWTTSYVTESWHRDVAVGRPVGGS